MAYTAEEFVSDDERIFYKSEPTRYGWDEGGFWLKFLCDGQWYYQGLHLNCRAPKAQERLFPAARRLYQRLRRDDRLHYTQTFRRVAS